MTLFLYGFGLGVLVTLCALSLCAVPGEDRADTPPPREIEPLPYTDMRLN